MAAQVAEFQQLDARHQEFTGELSHLPHQSTYPTDPHGYLEHIRRLKESVHVPVVASLNGVSTGGWTSYAELMQQAGADALELNLYFLSTRPHVDSSAVEDRSCEIVAAVRQAVTIPVAVKLSPFYTALPHFAQELSRVGANGVVLFNRFYQPDIHLEHRDVERTLEFSTPYELRLRLHWLAILCGQVPLSLAAAGGVHSASDALKAVMAGADAVQMVSALYQRGPEYLGLVRERMAQWLEEHGYGSLAQVHGCMALGRTAHPLAYERANYIQILHGPQPAGTPQPAAK